MKGLGYEAATVFDFGLSQSEDREIVHSAAEHGFILMTFDLDFVFLYRIFGEKKFGVVIFRLHDQTVESVNQAVDRLLESRCLDEKVNQRGVVIVDEVSIRVRRESET